MQCHSPKSPSTDRRTLIQIKALNIRVDLLYRVLAVSRSGYYACVTACPADRLGVHPFLAVIVFGANMGLADVPRPNAGKSGLKNPRGIRC